MAKGVYLKEPIPVIYGGARMDTEIMYQVITMDTEQDPAGAAQARLFMTIYAVLDFPFSVSFDTILLPWSIYQNSNNRDINTSLEINDEVITKQSIQ